jgi:hypothetical protein
MKRSFPVLAAGVLLSFFCSCDVLRDSPFEVTGWTPGPGYHPHPENLTVSLVLSHESDKAKTENAFSLTSDSGAVKGLFAWEGRRLVFKPLSPLEPNRDYRITLETGAQDLEGLSLENKFEASFTTRPPGERPRVLAVEPGWDGIIPETRGALRIMFSQVVTVNSCVAFVSFSPSPGGSWRLEDEGRTACFIPSEAWQVGVRYNLKIASGFSDALGRTLEEEYTSRFSIGLDQEKPCLLHAWVLNGEARTELSRDGEYAEWESFHKLELEFSEPVDAGSVRNALSAEPSAGLLMETDPGLSSSVVFRFTDKPLWGNPFLFRLRSGVKDEAGNESSAEYVYRIRASGPLSKPPVLIGIRLPMAPGETGIEAQEPLYFIPGDLFGDLPIVPGVPEGSEVSEVSDEKRFPYTKETPVWLELYFDTAPGAGINIHSLMEHFSVEATNNAIYFSPQSVRDSGFTWDESQEFWEKYERLEVRGVLTNTTNSGVVTFQTASGLEDTRGNASAVAYRISLLK